MPPLVCVVGRSEAGKTTLLEHLIPELKGRGYRVASIKHDTHGFDLDRPGKDSWRHAQAGSEAVLLSSPSQMALVRKVEQELSLDELVWLLRDGYDIVLAEGFRQSRFPKIEVHRAVAGGLLCAPEELMAVVSDTPLEVPVAQFSPTDAAGLATLLEQKILARRRREAVSLMVDGAQVPMAPFVETIIANVLLGLVSSLKGVEGPQRIELSWRKPSG